MSGVFTSSWMTLWLVTSSHNLFLLQKIHRIYVLFQGVVVDGTLSFNTALAALQVYPSVNICVNLRYQYLRR